MNEYLESSEIIDWRDPEVLALARTLGDGLADPVAVATRCFDWVRDEIRHSGDHQLDPVTCSASEALRHRTGFCYAKSHLLAALLRANGIPAGLCYQRLAIDDAATSFCLHGFNAVQLPEWGWYRADPRGNRPGLETRFHPPDEALAFVPRLPGEATFPNIWPEPLPIVVQALRRSETYQDLLAQLPDWNF